MREIGAIALGAALVLGTMGPAVAQVAQPPASMKGSAMKGREIAPGVLVAPQLTEADVVAAKAAGIRTIIGNRPDGEEPGQPTAADLAAVASQQGIRFVHIPVSGGQFPPEAVRAMDEALAAGGPTLAYCRSGARSATLWALSRAGRDAPDDLIAAGRRVGLDLEPLRPRLSTPVEGPPP